MFADVGRERALENALLEGGGRFYEPFSALLADAQLPQVVVHDVGVENIGAHVEGIVRFHERLRLGQVVLDDLACKQHAARLAADESRADHAVAHREIVFRSEIVVDHDAHALVFRHHHVAHVRAGVLVKPPLRVCATRIAEETVPRVDIAFARVVGLFRFLLRIEAAHADAIGQPFDDTRLKVEAMRQEHG